MAKAKKAAAPSVPGKRLNPKHTPWPNEPMGLDGYYKSEAVAAIDVAWPIVKRLEQAMEAWRIRLATTNAGATDPSRMTYERMLGQIEARKGSLGSKNVQYRALPHELNWLPYIKDAVADVAWFADAAKAALNQTTVSAPPQQQAAPKAAEKPAKSEGSTISTYEPPPSIPAATATATSMAPVMTEAAAPTEWTGPFGWSKGVTIGVGVSVGVLFLGGLTWAFVGSGGKPAPVATAITPPGAPVMGLSLFEHGRKRRRSRK